MTKTAEKGTEYKDNLTKETTEAINAIKEEEKTEIIDYIDITPKWTSILPAMLAVLENKKASDIEKGLIKSEIMRLGKAIDALNANGKVTTQ